MDTGGSGSKPLRILLVDDHPAVRDGLRLLLETEGIEVCAEAGDIAGALTHVKNYHPDLTLVDLSLADEDGLPLVERLRERTVPSLVYSMHQDAGHVKGAFAAGAIGYVTKREIHGVLIQAIRECAAGRRFVSPLAAVALTEDITQPIEPIRDQILSEQEQQVYRLLGQGEGTIEIATALHISTRTVDTYYVRIQEKLGLRGMRELRRHAVKRHSGKSEE